MDKGDELTVTAEEVSRSGNILSKATEYETELKVEKMTFKSIVGIAHCLNPMIRGWINYYGKFRPSELHKVFRLLRNRLLRWARKRYKRYKTSLSRANKWLNRIRKQFPYLFYHWQVGY